MVVLHFGNYRVCGNHIKVTYEKRELEKVDKLFFFK